MSNKYPTCKVCESGGISSYDCPNCHHKWKEYHEDRIRELERTVVVLQAEIDRVRPFIDATVEYVRHQCQANLHGLPPLTEKAYTARRMELRANLHRAVGSYLEGK